MSDREKTILQAKYPEDFAIYEQMARKRADH